MMSEGWRAGGTCSRRSAKPADYVLLCYSCSFRCWGRKWPRSEPELLQPFPTLTLIRPISIILRELQPCTCKNMWHQFQIERIVVLP